MPPPAAAPLQAPTQALPQAPHFPRESGTTAGASGPPKSANSPSASPSPSSGFQSFEHFPTSFDEFGDFNFSSSTPHFDPVGAPDHAPAFQFGGGGGGGGGAATRVDVSAPEPPPFAGGCDPFAPALQGTGDGGAGANAETIRVLTQQIKDMQAKEISLTKELTRERKLRQEAEARLSSKDKAAADAANAPDPSRPTWTCAVCTLCNDMDHGRCAACGERKPDTSTEVKFPGQGAEPETQAMGDDYWWTEYADEDGNPYWYNTHTGESTYYNPTEGNGADPGNIEDHELCVVCMDAKKNAVMVHGTTGHYSCCISCASKLENCAMCQAPIDMVVRCYES